MNWTPEREQRLSDLWKEGHSAKVIAAKLGGTTRSAVIGKASRLGLSERAGPINITAARARMRPEPTVDRLTDRTCRWPLGGPLDKAVHFCGATVAEHNRSYCPTHHRVCYAPAKRKESPS